MYELCVLMPELFFCVIYMGILENLQIPRREPRSPLVGLIVYIYMSVTYMYDELVCLISSRFQIEVCIGNISGF